MIEKYKFLNDILVLVLFLLNDIKIKEKDKK